jgi:hypothetical protein
MSLAATDHVSIVSLRNRLAIARSPSSPVRSKYSQAIRRSLQAAEKAKQSWPENDLGPLVFQSPLPTRREKRLTHFP